MATPATSLGPPPQRETPRPPVRPAPPPAERSVPATRLRPSDRKVQVLAFAASAAIHFLLILSYSQLGSGRRGVPASGLSPGPTRPQGMEVIQLAEVPEEIAQPEAPVAPERAVPVVPGAPAPEASAPGAVEAAPSEEPSAPRVGLPPVAERLRPPRTVDARLWRIDPDLTELSDRELARLLLTWTIEEMGDSALAAEARAEAGRDWTYTDKNGKKWGISDGQLHLGDVTIPLPFYFSPPPGSDAARRSWEDADVARGAQTAAARANMRDRIRAIRERRDREREQTSTIPPDTTKTRR